MTITDAGTARAFELLDEIEALNGQLVPKLAELSDLLGHKISRGDDRSTSVPAAPTRLPLGEGRKPIWQLLEGELFQFPDGQAFHRFVRLDPADGVTGLAGLRYGIHGSLHVDTTEAVDPDTVVSWCSEARADELRAEALNHELERMDARR